TPTGGLGGVWMSGARISSDSGDNLYFVTGNGSFSADSGGQNYGDSAIKLGTRGGLGVADWFTPFNQETLSSKDQDLGSGGILILPDQSGSHPHEALFAGKEGKIYVLDRDNMGHFDDSTDNVVQSIPSTIAGAFDSPAYFNQTVYFAGIGDT